MKKKIIIAIGGGRMYNKETFKIDKFIVEKTGKSKPRALFIPTASEDNSDYFQSFISIYGDLLGCEIDGLFLVKDGKSLTKMEIKTKILAADLIYVSGGNTLTLTKNWRRFGVGKMLFKAYEEGKVLAGMSAGSICWFNGGLSDSVPGRFVVVKGLGLIDAYHSPHYNLEKVKKSFDSKVNFFCKKGKWYILEDNTAMVVENSNFKIIKSNINAKAYCIMCADGEIQKVELVEDNEYQL